MTFANSCKSYCWPNHCHFLLASWLYTGYFLASFFWLCLRKDHWKHPIRSERKYSAMSLWRLEIKFWEIISKNGKGIFFRHPSIFSSLWFLAKLSERNTSKCFQFAEAFSWRLGKFVIYPWEYRDRDIIRQPRLGAGVFIVLICTKKIHRIVDTLKYVSLQNKRRIIWYWMRRWMCWSRSWFLVSKSDYSGEICR